MKTQKYLTKLTFVAVSLVALGVGLSSAKGETVIPLGNLFDDPAGTDLAVAIASDTYMAGPTTSNLGIELIVSGNNSGNVNIAPGINFNFSNVGGATSSANNVGNDTLLVSDTTPLRITGYGPKNGGSALGSVKIEDGIGMLAENRLTFNLDEIRAAGNLGTSAFVFSAIGAVDDTLVGFKDSRGPIFRMMAIVSDENGVLSGQVCGQDVSLVDNSGVWSFTGTIPAEFDGRDQNGDGTPDGTTQAGFLLDIPVTAKWLTLASTTGSGGNFGDHAVWVDAQLTPVPEPTMLLLLLAGSMMTALTGIRRRMATKTTC